MALHLMKNEKIIWESFPGKNFRLFVLIRDLFFGVILSIILFSVLSEIDNKLFKIVPSLLTFGVFFIFAAINQINLILTKYVLTTDRIVIQKGWLNKKLTSIKLENIVDTKVTQNFQERIINCGTIYLFTANDSQNSENDFLNNVPRFENIDSPFLLHTQIAEVIDGDYAEDYK